MQLIRVLSTGEAHFAWWENTDTGETRAVRMTQNQYDRWLLSDSTSIIRPIFASEAAWRFMNQVAGRMFLFDKPGGGTWVESDFPAGSYWVRVYDTEPSPDDDDQNIYRVQVLFLALPNDRTLVIHQTQDLRVDDGIPFTLTGGLSIPSFTMVTHGMTIVNDTLITSDNSRRDRTKRIYAKQHWGGVTGDTLPKVTD